MRPSPSSVPPLDLGIDLDTDRDDSSTDALIFEASLTLPDDPCRSDLSDFFFFAEESVFLSTETLSPALALSKQGSAALPGVFDLSGDLSGDRRIDAAPYDVV